MSASFSAPASSNRLVTQMFRWVLWLLALLILLSVGSVVLLRWVDPPTTAFIVRERLSAGEPGQPKSVQYRWVDGEQISPQVKVAVIASEDQKFPEHYGFDVESINEALEDRERGRRVRGASTLTQ